MGIIGYTILLTSRQPGVSYGGTIVVASWVFPAIAEVSSWPANNISGQAKRAIGHAFQLFIGTLAAIIGTQLYRSKWNPRNFFGHGTAGRFVICIVRSSDIHWRLAMGYLVGNMVFISILCYVMTRENERRDQGERDGELGDAGEDLFLGDDDPHWRFQTSER